MSQQIFIKDMSEAVQWGIGVFNESSNSWVFPLVLIPDEKRIRVDVHNEIQHCDVYFIDLKENESYFTDKWQLSLS